AIPFMSKKIADNLPAHVSYLLSSETLNTLDERYFSPSKKAKEKQDTLRDICSDLTSGTTTLPMTLYLRSSEKLGANAFALPDGTIVVTDDLVRLAEHNDEIISVLLHEIGHIEHRHALRKAIESTGLYALYSWITGDLEVSSTVI